MGNGIIKIYVKHETTVELYDIKVSRSIIPERRRKGEKMQL